MATLNENENVSAAPGTRMTHHDRLFLAFLFLVFCLVTWLGIHSRQEALKTEASKRNGEAWVTWLTEAGQKRFDSKYAPGACAGNGAPEATKPAPKPDALPGAVDKPTEEAPKPASNGPQAGTWGACLAHLMQHSSLKGMINPFTGKTPKFVEACVPAELASAGGIDIDKAIATPPGSAIPFIKSNLAPADSIKEKLQLTVTVCDKGGYPIKIAELEF